ncbi:MAG: CRISPR-associated helicase Cas3' [Pontibacterium sp.]
MPKSYFQYWGKAKKDPQQSGADYHLLAYHCLDVAAVGWLLLDPEKPLCRELAELLELTPDQVRELLAFALSLHDLGKFASAFQALVELPATLLVKPKARCLYDGKNYRHDMLGYYFWHQAVKEGLSTIPALSGLSGSEKRAVNKGLIQVLDCTLGHHGQPILHKNIEIEDFIEPDNTSASKLFIEAMVNLFKVKLPLEKLGSKSWLQKFKQVSWHIAGVSTLSDWLGSGRDHFPYIDDPTIGLESYWQQALQKAKAALSATDIHKALAVQPFRSVEYHFGFQPTPLQRWTQDVVLGDGPQLFILEDITGSGKTEAALTLAHRLMAKGEADGFYFGLPTMATSNTMFDRVGKHYLNMLSAEAGKPSIVLAHGAREMDSRFREAIMVSGADDKNYSPEDSTASLFCNEWLSDSRKKALLAPVGVGTIDQALLAVLPRRHQSIRLLGLHRKVLIFDEVHAADEFMFELLECLLLMHLHQGGSVILLTATLDLKKRERLCQIWSRQVIADNINLTRSRSFPLATQVVTGHPVSETPLTSRVDVTRHVAVEFVHSEERVIELIVVAIQENQSVVWVRNSVADAQRAYSLLTERLDEPEKCSLFHSRFVLRDRQIIEKNVMHTFGKKSTKNERAGRVLVATQVFQESLDADADLMISDICPVDDLIQRAGRLHRHTRDHNACYQKDIADTRPSPVLYVHSPEWSDVPDKNWLLAGFRNTQYVYRSPGKLWLGVKKLRELGGFTMPDNARDLIEAVYSDQAQLDTPKAFFDDELAYKAEKRLKAHQGKGQILNWQGGYNHKSHPAWFADATDISTRYSDIETVEILLVKYKDGAIKPLVGDPLFAIQLSTLKLAKHVADKLACMSGKHLAAETAFKKKNKRAKYMQCWLAVNDSGFSYSDREGFLVAEKSPQ